MIFVSFDSLAQKKICAMHTLGHATNIDCQLFLCCPDALDHMTNVWQKCTKVVCFIKVCCIFNSSSKKISKKYNWIEGQLIYDYAKIEVSTTSCWGHRKVWKFLRKCMHSIVTLSWSCGWSHDFFRSKPESARTVPTKFVRNRSLVMHCISPNFIPDSLPFSALHGSNSAFDIQ